MVDRVRLSKTKRGSIAFCLMILISLLTKSCLSYCRVYATILSLSRIDYREAVIALVVVRRCQPLVCRELVETERLHRGLTFWGAAIFAAH